MVNFTRLRLVKFIPISNTTLVIFIPNFTATHAITSTNDSQTLQINAWGVLRRSNIHSVVIVSFEAVGMSSPIIDAKACWGEPELCNLVSVITLHVLGDSTNNVNYTDYWSMNLNNAGSFLVLLYTIPEIRGHTLTFKKKS